MRLQLLADKVLTILAENARDNDSPKVMDSETIAGKLAMSLPETRQLLKVLDGAGVIMHDIDGRYSLITRKGVSWLLRTHPAPSSLHFQYGEVGFSQA